MRICLLILTLCFVLLVSTTAQVSAQLSSSEYVDGQIIVRFNNGLDAKTAQQSLDQTRFVVDQLLVNSLDVYLVKLTSRITVAEALEEMKGYSFVRWAQADHIVKERLTPNDPSFLTAQWNMNQPSDVDIDAPEAWDIATGGHDQSGEDIVVAVVDGGCLLTHNDLAANIWTNSGEVAGNGIDDDSNGYIDDINGWDAYENNGGLPIQNHGTHVAGIVGAVGNNNLRVAGVNWNVKMMIVAASSSTTSIVSIGYNYVIAQKELWWQSDGTAGANVVATNSSFGVDNASCTSGSYPIWNDLYNEMGALGILSAAATANNAVNVDVVGDVPTQCTSPYLVTVTNTTSSDLKNSGSAWGAISIDLGAPGTGILSTTSDGTAGYNTGTSMASPHVAGAIALMHAAASVDFNQYYYAQPESAILIIKDLVLSTVDSIPALDGITVSYGRLNLFRAVNEISSYAAEGSTYPNLRYASSMVIDTINSVPNGRLDRGDSAAFVVDVLNVSALATGVYGVLSTTDSFVTVLDSEAVWSDIETDSMRANWSDLFVLYADTAAPMEHVATMRLTIHADTNYVVNREFSLMIGRKFIYWSDSVRSGENGWTHGNVLPAFSDNWHISTELYASPDSSWKCGSTGAGLYDPLLDAGLVSPLIEITPQSTLTFDSWIESELSGFYPDSAYDGGLIEISVNGSAFAIIPPLDGYSKHFRYLRSTGNPYTGPLPGAACIAGTTAWLTKTIDLAPYVGDSVQFRFRFCSDSGTQREGWYLDNFTISGEEPLPPPPDLRFDRASVIDTIDGPQNGRFDSGETAALEVAISDLSTSATGISGVLTTLDPYVAILDSDAVWPDIQMDSVKSNFADLFVVRADSLTPIEHIVQFELSLFADGGYSANCVFSLMIGRKYIYWTDSVRDGENGWTHTNVLAGFGDQWHISTELSASPDSAWKCGSMSEGEYSPLLDAGLVSPSILITPQSTLTFDAWIQSELSIAYPDSAYDGGLVEISANGGPFNLAVPLDGYTKHFRYSRGGVPYEGPLPGQSCLAGSSLWLTKIIDLTSYAGEAVRFRFRFCSDDATQREGWYIDNFTISGQEPVPQPPLPVNDLVIQIVGVDAVLSWTEPDSTIDYYVVHRNASIDSLPSPLDSIGFTPTLQYVDSGIVISESLNFYSVVGVRP